MPSMPAMTNENTVPALDIIGIGSALVDLVIEVDDAFIAEQVDGAKGGMELVEAATIESIVAASGKEVSLAAGGAASNTTVGAAALGLTAAFIGCSGADELADFYEQALRERNCQPRIARLPDEPTGRVLSMVTPDTERTMRTCLGASALQDPQAIKPETFAGARLVMLEGYTLFNHDLTRAIAQAAKAAGAELALDLASFEVVNANRAVLVELLDGMVDLVFANEAEARAWNDEGETAALADLANRCKVAVVKLGSEGAMILSGDERHDVGVIDCKPVDTTGAGDNWAAGFLAGYLRGLPLDICGHLGAMAGAAAVSVTGAQVPLEEWKRIRGYLDSQLS